MRKKVDSILVEVLAERKEIIVWEDLEIPLPFIQVSSKEFELNDGNTYSLPTEHLPAVFEKISEKNFISINGISFFYSSYKIDKKIRSISDDDQTWNNPLDYANGVVINITGQTKHLESQFEANKRFTENEKQITKQLKDLEKFQKLTGISIEELAHRAATKV